MNAASPCPALSLLYQKHRQELIRHLCKIVRCEHTAEDLMQETMLRIAGLNIEERLEQPRAFLYRTATNLALDYLRRQKTRAHADLTDTLNESLPSEWPSVEQEVFDQQRFDLFMQALDSLPPRCRQVFVLHRLHHFSYSEIADCLDISQSAVEKNIIRALTKCHAYLNKQDAEPW